MGMNLKCILCQFQLKHNLPSSSFQEASHKMSDLISSNPVILSPNSVLTINLMKGVAAAAFDHQALLLEERRAGMAFSLGHISIRTEEKSGRENLTALIFAAFWPPATPEPSLH